MLEKLVRNTTTAVTVKAYGEGLCRQGVIWTARKFKIVAHSRAAVGTGSSR
jgi:hypothetical protein